MKDIRTFTLKLMAQDKPLFDSMILKGEKERTLILDITKHCKRTGKGKETAGNLRRIGGLQSVKKAGKGRND